MLHHALVEIEHHLEIDLPLSHRTTDFMHAPAIARSAPTKSRQYQLYALRDWRRTQASGARSAAHLHHVGFTRNGLSRQV